MFKLTPTNTRFHGCFERAGELVVEAAGHFAASVQHFESASRLAAEITRLENDLDEITHETMDLLHSSFITPLERGDIRRLMIALDGVVDALDDATRRMAIYRVEVVWPPVLNMALVLDTAAKGARLAVEGVWAFRKDKEVLDQCVLVHQCEDEGDFAYQEALEVLFDGTMEPLEVIKWKDVIDDLELAIDRCQEVAVVVEEIVINNG